jgi:AcrR family transcriptional regulator
VLRPADPEKLPRILEAASHLFAERPFNMVHMKDIADRAEVAKGTLYLHFDTKEALFRAMIAEVGGRQLEACQARIASEPNATRQLRMIIDDAVKFSARYPHYLETVYHLDGNPERSEDAMIRNRRERRTVQSRRERHGAGNVGAAGNDASRLDLYAAAMAGRSRSVACRPVLIWVQHAAVEPPRMTAPSESR